MTNNQTNAFTGHAHTRNHNRNHKIISNRSLKKLHENIKTTIQLSPREERHAVQTNTADKDNRGTRRPGRGRPPADLQPTPDLTTVLRVLTYPDANKSLVGFQAQMKTSDSWPLRTVARLAEISLPSTSMGSTPGVMGGGGGEGVRVHRREPSYAVDGRPLQTDIVEKVKGLSAEVRCEVCNVNPIVSCIG